MYEMQYDDDGTPVIYMRVDGVDLYLYKISAGDVYSVSDNRVESHSLKWRKHLYKGNLNEED